MVDTKAKVVQWGADKGILDNSDPQHQFLKTLEEVNELYEAILDNDVDAVKDAIGDIRVTLILQAELWGLDEQDCLDHAFSVISGRTGKMVNGVFVKDK